MHAYLHVIPRLRWQDALDILIVAYVIYRITLLIRGTRTMQMVVGLGILAAAFVSSQMLGLFTLNWLLNNFLGSLIIILVVIFQSDIRRALTGVGARSFFTARPNVSDIADELVKAAEWLSARRIGGLIVIEQEVGLQDVVDTGRVIDGRASPELNPNPSDKLSPRTRIRFIFAQCAGCMKTSTAITPNAPTNPFIGKRSTSNAQLSMLNGSEVGC